MLGHHNGGFLNFRALASTIGQEQEGFLEIQTSNSFDLPCPRDALASKAIRRCPGEW